MMMEAARTVQSKGNNLPDPVEPKNELDKLKKCHH